MVNQRAHLPKPIMHGVSSWSKMVTVNKVQVPGDLAETPSRDSIGNRSLVKARVLAPVVVY